MCLAIFDFTIAPNLVTIRTTNNELRTINDIRRTKKWLVR
jgi:hypothetical protein